MADNEQVMRGFIDAWSRLNAAERAGDVADDVCRIGAVGDRVYAECVDRAVT